LRVGRACAELRDRMMVGIRTGQIEVDELWSYVAHNQKRTTPRIPPLLGSRRIEGRPLFGYSAYGVAGEIISSYAETPSVQLGIADHLWTLGKLLRMLWRCRQSTRR